MRPPKMTKFGCLMRLTLIVCIHIAEALKVSLSSEPSLIKDGFTDKLKIRCTFEHTPGDDIHADFKLAHVSSLIVSRGYPRDYVAVLLMYDPVPHILVGDTNLQVDGLVKPGIPTETPYMELTWSRPTKSQAETYTCEIICLDEVGHALSIETNTTVNYEVPSLGDIIDHIVNLEHNLSSILTTIKMLDSVSIQEGVSVFQAHSCSDVHQDVSLPIPYSTPPVVSVNVVAQVRDNKQQDSSVACGGNSGYRLQVKNVTTTGFRLQLTTYVFEGTLEAKWTSYPTPLLVSIT